VRGHLASKDRAGIRRAVVASVATRPEQVRKISDWCISIRSERIVPFASIHPGFPDPEAEVERIAAAGIRGLKFHPQYSECPMDDPRVVRIARAAAKAGLAMLFHSGYDLAYEKEDLASPDRVRRIHEAVPELRMTAAHLGGWERWSEVLELVAGQEIYLETSYTLGRCPPDVLERIFAKHRPEFLLFGTDAPWRDQKEDLARFMALPLSDDLKRRILWDNALRFVGMAG
jgi:predicted TIM-barrel fold metal-dependent hydrolase